MESSPFEKKDRLICFKAFSTSRQMGRSTDSIPRVFGSLEKGSSLDDSSLRRPRSFSLPRVLRRDSKENKQGFSFRFVFGTKTNQREACPSDNSSMKGNGQSTPLKQNGNCNGLLSGKQSSKEKKQSSAGKSNFTIPKICIQTPEEVNLILQLQPITLTLEQESTQHLMHDGTDIKECKTSKEDQCVTTAPDIDRDDKRRRPRRKRSASWGGEAHTGISCGGDIKICPTGELKSSISWSAFLDSDTSRETDLCSTEL